MARRKDGKPTTSTLLTMLNNASEFKEVKALLKDEQEPTFNNLVYEIMSEKNLSAKDMILRTGIERSYFYHILNGTKHPGRNMVLRMAFSMGATLNETNHLLKLAGLSELYPRIRRDAVLIFCLQRKYNLNAANDFLLKEDEEPLYREDNNA